MREPGFLIYDDNSPIIDFPDEAQANLPPEAVGPVVVVCPHCGHDERGHSGPHEMFDVVSETTEQALPAVSSRHFRCRECSEVSPLWVICRGGTVVTHMREAESGDPCVPRGFLFKPPEAER